MTKKRYPDSPYYRTGNMRIVPWYFGLMRAEEEWRSDRYDQLEGINTGFTLKWCGVGALPPDINSNFYSYTCAEHYDGEDPYRRKWKSFITWLGGMGVKDPKPSSPADVSRFHRKLLKERLKEQEVLDRKGYSDD